MEKKQTSQPTAEEDSLAKQQITLRDGNVAYEIDRPLFNTDASIDLA
jgi:hypothetical protein